MYLTAFGNATTKLAAATKKRMNTVTAFKSIKSTPSTFRQLLDRRVDFLEWLTRP